MTCPWCSYENLPRANFCGDCGRALQFDAACDTCLTANPVSHTFCDTCGAALTVGAEPTTAAPPVPAKAALPADGRVTTQAVQQQSASIDWPDLLRLPRPGLAWDRPAPQWRWSWRHVAAVVSRNRLELAAVLALTIVAGLVRTYHLAALPGGLHGDEALTGLDALRILEDGWIGPYTGSALGQPTGPLYFTALVFKLLGANSFTLHLSMALLGVATIPAAYFLFRIGFGRWVALFGTIALTFSYWHLFFSRTGFMVVSMPLMTTLAAAAILLALRSSTRWSWFIAGILVGLGIYSYNGYLAFLVIVAVFLAAVLVLGRDNLRTYAVGMAFLAIGFVVSALPMLRVMYLEPDFYFQHHRTVSVLREPKFQEARSVGEKAGYFAGRAWDAAMLPLRYPKADGVDGFGERGAVDPVTGLLAYIGLAIAVARWRSPPHLFLAVAFVLGLGVLVVGLEDLGEMRRTLIIVPFVFGLAGVAVVEIGRAVVRTAGAKSGRIAYVGGAAILAVVMTWNTWTYFGQIVHEERLNWVYAVDLVEALDTAHEFEDPGRIYFYAARWRYDYEIRRFLYPDTPGVDRSKEFGEFSLEKTDDGPVTYVLLSPYAAEIDALRDILPGGKAVEEYNPDGGRRFSVYHLPTDP